MRFLASKQLIASMLYGAAIVYLAFHALHGEQGLYALVKELRRKDMLSEQWLTLKAEREMLTLRVSRLRDQSLDADLLDESARRNLGLVGNDEIILLRDSPSR